MKHLEIKRELLEGKIFQTLCNEYDRWSPLDEYECIFDIQKGDNYYFGKVIFTIDEFGAIDYGADEHIEVRLNDMRTGEKVALKMNEKSIFNLQLKVDQFFEQEEIGKQEDIDHVKAVEETQAWIDLNY